MTKGLSNQLQVTGRLAGKTAVVTGGARGIGRAIVQRFAEEGAAVAVFDVDASGGTRAEQELQLQGRSARFFACDVAREEQVRKAIHQASSALGPVTILVNNAGVNAYFDATQMTEPEWEDVFAVDLKGAWLCAKHVIPHMLEGKQGTILNISSIHAFTTAKGMFPYAAAKSGLLGLTRSLALDYAAHNIRVNAICPGWIRTHLVAEWLSHQPDPVAAEESVLAAHPLGRIGSPEDVASLACFLASDEAAFITGGAHLIDGGLSAKFAV